MRTASAVPPCWTQSSCGGVVVMVSLALHAPACVEADQRPGSRSGGDSPSAEEVERNWNNFRGPGANGCAPHARPPLSWNAKEGKNILWKTPVPKHGMSSPVVWGKRVFLTGADDSSRQIYCFDADSGKLLWQHDVDGLPGFPSGSKLPRVLDETGFASPTATTNGEYVAAIFSTGELVCMNMNGERVWAKHLGVPANHYGHASSLMSHKKLLFVQYDQKSNGKLLAFDLASGKPAWEATRDAISWSSPILIENRQRMELVLMSSKAVESYDPMTGSSSGA
jgi:outer membrane protein assembly factor BamB